MKSFCFSSLDVKLQDMREKKLATTYSTHSVSKRLEHEHALNLSASETSDVTVSFNA